MKGALPQTTVIKIVGVLLIGSIVMTVLGNIGSAIVDTGDSIMDFTGTSEHVVIEDEETFIAAARYTLDRADDCDVVEKNSYPGLEDTDYGEEPRCAGVSGTMAASLTNTLPGQDTGGDMEGRNSRVSFEISEEDFDGERMVLKSDQQYEEAGRVLGLGGVSEEESFSQVIDPDCGSHYQSATAFMIAFDDFGQWGDRRTTHVGASESLDSSMSVYCRDGDPWFKAPIDEVDGEDGRFEVTLCPGDEGYFQSNKEEPMNEGEATSADDRHFPHIQIESIGDEPCVDDDFHDHEMKGYEGPQTGHQIYVKSQTSAANFGDLREWPGVFNFELRQDDDIVEEIGQWESDITNRGEKCTIFYQRDAASLDEATERSYSKGTVVDQNQDTFEHEEGFTREQSSHRGITDGNDAKTLIGDMSLDGGFVSTESQLRKSPEGLEGDLNELYGDLMCVEQSGSGYAAWEICLEDNEGETQIADGMEWECSDNEWVEDDED